MQDEEEGREGGRTGREALILLVAVVGSALLLLHLLLDSLELVHFSGLQSVGRTVARSDVVAAVASRAPKQTGLRPNRNAVLFFAVPLFAPASFILHCTSTSSSSCL